MNFNRFAAVAAICAGLFGAGNASAVTGDSIYATWNVDFLSYDYWPFGTKTVGPGVEFTAENNDFPVQFDFTEYTLKITFTSSPGFADFPFNGYVFKDLTSNFSGYMYVLDAAGTTVPNFTDAYFTHSGDTITANMAGLYARVGDTILIRAVPEPETYAMLLGGLGVVGWMARRRKQRSARA
jgi:hypothetical protein